MREACIVKKKWKTKASHIFVADKGIATMLTVLNYKVYVKRN